MNAFVKTACPHDCPSACALEVERLAPDRIGRVRGASAFDYTDGVVCAKVARYAERVHLRLGDGDGAHEPRERGSRGVPRRAAAVDVHVRRIAVGHDRFAVVGSTR